MGPTVVHGLPAHVLLVHVVVVMVPLTALALVVCAIWPTWIRRLGIVLPLLALVTLASVPLTTHAGEWLKQHVYNSPLVRRHAELGGTLLPWVAGLFVVAVAVWWLGRGTPSSSATGEEDGSSAAISRTPIRIAAIVLSLVVAGGSVVQVYRIGDSGARAAWQGSYSAKPVTQSGN